MKKLISLVATLLLAAGLVAAAPAPSKAAPCDAYTGCAATRVVITGASVARAQRRTPYSYNIRVRPAQGNGTPRGGLYVTIRGGGVKYDRFYPNYNGRLITTRVRFKRPGRAVVRAQFVGDSIWRNSSGAKGVRVIRR